MTYRRSIRNPERGASLVEHSLTVVLIAVVVMASTSAVSSSLYSSYFAIRQSLSGGSMGTNEPMR